MKGMGGVEEVVYCFYRQVFNAVVKAWEERMSSVTEYQNRTENSNSKALEHTDQSAGQSF